MKKVVRLSESDLARVVRRIINEQPIAGDGPGMDLPKCDRFMKPDGKDPSGYPVPGSGSVLRGPFDMIQSNGAAPPEYQGYTVYKDGRPFCFIPNR